MEPSARLGRGHAYNEERSIWLHRAIARRLRRDPAAVRATARANLERLRRIHSPSVEGYVGRWAALLDGPLDELCAALVATDQEARDLRQATPFSGVLTPAERWDVYRAFRRWYTGEAGEP